MCNTSFTMLGIHSFACKIELQFGIINHNAHKYFMLDAIKKTLINLGQIFNYLKAFMKLLYFFQIDDTSKIITSKIIKFKRIHRISIKRINETIH